METNQIEIREESTVFNVQFEIKHKTALTSQVVYSITDRLMQYRDVCILALDMRMKYCITSLMKHQDDVIEANKNGITYTKNNDSIAHFNTNSYKSMQCLLQDLQNETLTTNLDYFYPAIAQLVKALYWISIKPEGFGELVSCLVNYLTTHRYEE